MSGRNGGVVGVLNQPTVLAARGCWRPTDVAHYIGAGLWPVAGYLLLAHAAAGSANGSSVVTSAIDTTGATFIVVHASWITSGAATLSDSKGNTWTKLTTRSATTVQSAIYYCDAPTVGTGHTFTFGNVGSNFPTICVAAFGGAASSPFDQQNGTANSGPSASQAIGSITPTQDRELIIAGLAFYDGSFGTISINSGMTITDTVAFANGSHFGGSMAYTIQSAAAAINPTWAWTTGGNERAVNIASFKAA